MAEIIASKTPPAFVINAAVSFSDELTPKLNPIFESKYKSLKQSKHPTSSLNKNRDDSGFRPS